MLKDSTMSYGSSLFLTLHPKIWRLKPMTQSGKSLVSMSVPEQAVYIRCLVVLRDRTGGLLQRVRFPKTMAW